MRSDWERKKVIVIRSCHPERSGCFAKAKQLRSRRTPCFFARIPDPSRRSQCCPTTLSCVFHRRLLRDVTDDLYRDLHHVYSGQRRARMWRRAVLGNSQPPQPPHASEVRGTSESQGASGKLLRIARSWRPLLGVITSIQRTRPENLARIEARKSKEREEAKIGRASRKTKRPF